MLTFSLLDRAGSNSNFRNWALRIEETSLGEPGAMALYFMVHQSYSGESWASPSYPSGKRYWIASSFASLANWWSNLQQPS